MLEFCGHILSRSRERASPSRTFDVDRGGNGGYREMAARHILSRRKRGRRHGHRSSGCSSWISSNPQNCRTTVICTWYVNRQENGVIALTVAHKSFLPPGGSECKRCAASLSSQCDECPHISHSFRRAVNASDVQCHSARSART